MSGEIATGLFTLGGAGVGVLTTWLTTSAQRQETNRTRLDKLTETRRLLYSTLVERSDVFVDAARDVLSYDDPTEVPDEDKEGYLEAWDNLVQARASVEIIGTESAAVAATELYQAIADIGNQADAWLFRHVEWTDAEEHERNGLLTMRKAKRDHFIDVARSIVKDGNAN